MARAFAPFAKDKKKKATTRSVARRVKFRSGADSKETIRA